MVNLIWFVLGMMAAGLLLWLFAGVYNLGEKEGAKKAKSSKAPDPMLYTDNENLEAK